MLAGEVNRFFCSRIFLLLLFPDTVLGRSLDSCCSLLGNSHAAKHPCVTKAKSVTEFLNLAPPHSTRPELLGGMERKAEILR